MSMPSRSVVQTYDYLRRVASQFTDDTARATVQAYNEAEFEHEMNNAIASYFVLRPSTHVMSNVRVPRYDLADPVHRRLAELSRQAHVLALASYEGDDAAQAALRQVEEEIDQAAADLWGLAAEELAEIRRSLEELR
jgi:hypothetical protein